MFSISDIRGGWQNIVEQANGIRDRAIRIRDGGSRSSSESSLGCTNPDPTFDSDF